MKFHINENTLVFTVKYKIKQIYILYRRQKKAAVKSKREQKVSFTIKPTHNPFCGISIRDHMLLKRQLSFFVVIDVIAANVLCLNGNRHQNANFVYIVFLSSRLCNIFYESFLLTSVKHDINSSVLTPSGQKIGLVYLEACERIYTL